MLGFAHGAPSCRARTTHIRVLYLFQRLSYFFNRVVVAQQVDDFAVFVYEVEVERMRELTLLIFRICAECLLYADDAPSRHPVKPRAYGNTCR